MKKKAFICVTLCLVIILSCVTVPGSDINIISNITASAVDDEPVLLTENDLTFKLNASEISSTGYTVSVTGYKASYKKVIVPDTIQGHPVTVVASTAFWKNKKITYVKLPKYLMTIPGNAFLDCSALETIEIDSSNSYFTSSEGVLYAKDTNKKSPTYQKVVLLKIFPAGKPVESFTIPSHISTIGQYAFAYAYKLKSVNMYNNVSKIEAYAFYNCWNLSDIRLSDNLRYLGVKSLAYCESLRSLSLPATLISIGGDALLGGIDYSDNKFYFYTEGINCVKGTYAYYYLLKLGLPEAVIGFDYRSITDIDSGVTFIDLNSLLPLETDYDLSVSKIGIDTVEELLPTRYNKAYAYDISLISKGNSYKNIAYAEETEYTPGGKFVLQFNGVDKNTIVSATKVYKDYGSKLVPVNGAPNTPFVGTQINTFGRFVVLSNNDFSLKGDVDGDGVVTLYDARVTLHAAAKTLTLTTAQTKAADIDSNGKISTTDARNVLRYAAGITKNL